MGNTKITSFYNNIDVTRTDNTETRPKKRPKIISPCPGFANGKNTDLLLLYDKYQKIDDVSQKIAFNI